MAEIHKSVIAVIGIDIGKNSFHVVGLAGRGAVALRQRWSRGRQTAPASQRAGGRARQQAGSHRLERPRP